MCREGREGEPETAPKLCVNPSKPISMNCPCRDAMTCFCFASFLSSSLCSDENSALSCWSCKLYSCKGRISNRMQPTKSCQPSRATKLIGYLLLAGLWQGNSIATSETTRLAKCVRFLHTRHVPTPPVVHIPLEASSTGPTSDHDYPCPSSW